jgi:hypothetical protein
MMIVSRRMPILVGRRRTHPHVCRTDSRRVASHQRGVEQVRQVIRVGVPPVQCIGWIPDGVVRAWLLWLAAEAQKERRALAESDRLFILSVLTPLAPGCRAFGCRLSWTKGAPDFLWVLADPFGPPVVLDQHALCATSGLCVGCGRPYETVLHGRSHTRVCLEHACGNYTSRSRTPRRNG